MKLQSIDLLIVFSLGRSGSTFLAREVSRNSKYFNAGENRYFWQELVKQSPIQHPDLIAEFYSKRKHGGFILDKTPELWSLFERVNFGEHQVSLIELSRQMQAIKSSRENFTQVLSRPERIMKRIRKYRRDYGWRWIIPMLQRWHFMPAILGMKSHRAFSTLGGSLSIDDEYKMFQEFISRISSQYRVHSIDYDSFSETIWCLKEIGFSNDAVENIIRAYKKP